jgi:nicotinamidase-related amidase
MITQLDEQTALVVIDLQNGITQRPLPGMKEVVGNASKLVDAFHGKELPVVLVNVNPQNAAWTKTRKEQGSNHALPESLPAEWFEITADIHTLSTDIFITKQNWNAFFATALHEELQKKNVTQIVLAGVATSIGVEGTARAASELGYNIAFAKDGMLDMTEAHDNSIKYIFPRLGEIDTTENIIAKLNG